MRVVLGSQGNRLGVMSLVVSTMPWFYDMARWLPDSRYARIIFGPFAVLAAAALAGAAAAHGSRWWLLALVGPLAGIMLLLTAHV
jgi:fatty acid desaturase